MSINIPLKRKQLTLIELLVAVCLLSIILTEGLFMLSSQTKHAAQAQIKLKSFFKKEETVIALEGFFFHLNVHDNSCLKADDKIYLHFDNHFQKDPLLSGFQKGSISLEDGVLSFEFEGKNKKIILAQAVQSFSLSFYSQKTNWQKKWQSTSLGLPEMIHVNLKTKDFEIDQKFLCPYKQIPVMLSCKFFPLFFH